MSETPISPLRQRMIEDMTVRKLGAATQRNYVRAVKTLSEFLGRSPASATPEDLRRFQVHQSEAGAQPPVMNNTVSALRFFFRVTLDRPEMARHLTLVRQPRKLPNVLNEEEVVRLLENASGLKYRAALGVAYGAGLRVSEVANLKVCDVDSKRMLIRVEEGKGKKDRNAMLSPRLLELLRDWWWVGRPTTWLFPGRDPLLPVTARQLYRVVREAAEAAEIKTRVTPHTLRHSFATHLLEQGVDIRMIQSLPRRRPGCCWATPSSTRRRATPTWRARCCARSRARSTGSPRSVPGGASRRRSAGVVARPALELADIFRDRHVEDMLPA